MSVLKNLRALIFDPLDELIKLSPPSRSQDYTSNISPGLPPFSNGNICLRIMVLPSVLYSRLSLSFAFPPVLKVGT